MAMEKFRAAPLPNPTQTYSPEQMRQLIRVLEVYFNQLDSLTPNQAQSYKADKFILNTANTTLPAEGELNWDAPDGTVSIGMESGVVQQIGQELYVRVVNNTGSTIPNGTLVGYVSASATNNVVEVSPYIADGTELTTDFIGMMTHDLPDSGDLGYATTVGLVRGLNTSAFTLGDVLYASPTVAGAFTNVKPTAPDNVVTLGYVAKVGTTDGVVFVRPVLEQQMYYGTFARITDYTPATANTAYAIPLDDTRIANGIVIGTPASRVVVPQSGFYDISATIQYVSTNASAKTVYSWVKANGVDVIESTRLVTVAGNGVYHPILISETVSLAANEYIEIMVATSDATITATAAAATAFSPASPAVNLVVTQVQQ